MVQTTRRSTRGAPKASAQTKIAFGNKVTKRTNSIGKDVQAEPAKSKLSQVETAEITKKPDIVTLDDSTKDVKVKIGAKGDAAKLIGVEKEAESIKPAQIKAYWKDCENERIAPRGEFNHTPAEFILFYN